LEDEDGNPVGEGSGVGPGVSTAKGRLEGKAGEAAEEARRVGIDPTEGKPGSGEGEGVAAPGGAFRVSLSAPLRVCSIVTLVVALELGTIKLTFLIPPVPPIRSP
jgi:hypothetical protein